MTVTIRNAVPTETGILADFQYRLAAETEDLSLDPDVVRHGVERSFDDSAVVAYLVAESPDDVIVGCLQVQREWSDWLDTERWWVHDVFVSTDSRGRGVFRALFDEVERRAREAGVTLIRLFCDRDNHVARNAYETIGFGTGNYILYEKEL